MSPFWTLRRFVSGFVMKWKPCLSHQNLSVRTVSFTFDWCCSNPKGLLFLIIVKGQHEEFQSYKEVLSPTPYQNGFPHSFSVTFLTGISGSTLDVVLNVRGSSDPTKSSVCTNRKRPRYSRLLHWFSYGGVEDDSTHTCDSIKSLHYF